MSIPLTSCLTCSGTLDSSIVLLPYPITLLELHITIILISNLKHAHSQKSTPLRVSLEGLPTRQPVPKHLQQYVEPTEETYDMQKFAERCAKPSSSTAGGRLSRR